MNGIPKDARDFAEKALQEERYAEAKRVAIGSYLTLYTTPTGWEMHYWEGCPDTRRVVENCIPATPEQREALAFCLNCHNERARRRAS